MTKPSEKATTGKGVPGGTKKPRPFEATLTNCDFQLALLMHSMQIEFTRSEIADRLFRVWEEIGYIPEEIDVEKETREGYLILSRIVMHLLRTENPDALVVCSVLPKHPKKAG